MSSFEQRGYSPACLQNDLQAIRRLDRAGVLNNHNPSYQRSERIPLVLSYHPLNERIKRILLRNFNILSSDPETRAVFPQPALVAYCRDSNLRDSLVHTSDSSQSSFKAGTSPCLHAGCRACHYIFSDTSVRGPQNSCHQEGVLLPNVWLGLLHLLSPLPCPLYRRNRAHFKTTFWRTPSEH